MHNNNDLASSDDITAKLRNLTSLISHARQIERDADVLVRMLREPPVNPVSYRVDTRLTVNLQHLREILSGSDDAYVREFFIAPFQRKAAVIFLEGMVDEALITNNIIEKLTLPPAAGLPYQQEEILTSLKRTFLTAAVLTQVDELAEAVNSLLAGDTLLLVDGVASLLVISSRKVEHRTISEPETESSVQAPRDGFVEGLQINITLLRRRLKDPDLVVKKLIIGTKSHTDLAVVYLRGFASPQLVSEAEHRLKRIKLDAPASIGFLQGLIEDHPYSPFPTMLATERPDKVAAALAEGKIALLMDGSPFVLLAPATFPDFFQTSDDYNEKWSVSSIIRLTRYFSVLIAVATPAFFVAMTTFHPGLLPTPLTITIAISRLGIPFPAFLEALIMESILEILQEAGVRLPKPIGPAVSIFGGLVIGEATVRAGFVSAPMIIVIALSAIASFNIANYRFNLIVRLFRVPLLILSTTLGMFGVMIGLLALVAHLSTLESFGVPYLSPITPRSARNLRDLQDTFVVAPPSLPDYPPAYLTQVDAPSQDK